MRNGNNSTKFSALFVFVVSVLLLAFVLLIAHRCGDPDAEYDPDSKSGSKFAFH